MDNGWNESSNLCVISGGNVTAECTLEVDLPLNGDNKVTHGKNRESLEIAHLKDSAGNQIVFQSIKNDPTDKLNNVIINVACEPGTLMGCSLTLLFKNV